MFAKNGASVHDSTKQGVLIRGIHHLDLQTPTKFQECSMFLLLRRVPMRLLSPSAAGSKQGSIVTL